MVTHTHYRNHSAWYLKYVLRWCFQRRKGMGRWYSRFGPVGCPLLAVAVRRRWAKIAEQNWIIKILIGLIIIPSRTTSPLTQFSFFSLLLAFFRLILSRSTAYQELATTIAHSLQAQRRLDAKISQNVRIRFTVEGWQRLDGLHVRHSRGLCEASSGCNYCQAKSPQAHGRWTCQGICWLPHHEECFWWIIAHVCCALSYQRTPFLSLSRCPTEFKQPAWVDWSRTRWFSAGLTAGDRTKTSAHGKHSCKPFVQSALHAWLCWCRRASTSSPTQLLKSAETLTSGGWFTMAAYSCCCHSCWSNIAHGRTVRCGSSRLHKWKTIRFRLRRIWRFSCTICELRRRWKLWKWWERPLTRSVPIK